MKKTLFLLGLIRNAEIHGYQIMELIGSHFGLIVNITKPTAYRLLNKMTDDGWVEYRNEQMGSRPSRKVYSITPEGERAFQQILKQQLADFDPVQYSDAVSLAFLNVLPKSELLPLLEQRIKNTRLALDQLKESEAHMGDYQMLFAHQRRHFETEIASIRDIIANLA